MAQIKVRYRSGRRTTGFLKAGAVL